MKKSELRLMVRKIVREEVAMSIQEVISELKQPTQSTPSKPIQEAHYSSNKVLNDVLNETANGDDWKTLGGSEFTTDRMREIVGGNYGDMMNDTPKQTQTTNPNDPMSQFLNKDYSSVLEKTKQIDDRKNGNRS